MRTRDRGRPMVIGKTLAQLRRHGRRRRFRRQQPDGMAARAPGGARPATGALSRLAALCPVGHPRLGAVAGDSAGNSRRAAGRRRNHRAAAAEGRPAIHPTLVRQEGMGIAPGCQARRPAVARSAWRRGPGSARPGHHDVSRRSAHPGRRCLGQREDRRPGADDAAVVPRSGRCWCSIRRANSIG